MNAFSLGDLQIIRGLAAGKTQAQIGEELHVEQSTISKMLKAAEDRSGLHVVELSGRRLALSEAGRALAPAAVRALAAFEDIDAFVADLRCGRRGSIRCVASSTPGSYVIPQLIASFLRERPEISIDVQIVPVSSLWSIFESEQLDFAIAPALGLPSDLRAEPLYDDQVAFFTAPGSPLARRREVSFADLASETLIGKFVDSHWRSIFRELERRGFRAARTVTIIPPEGVKRIVSEGLGVGVLFESSIRHELDEGRLVRLPIFDPSLQQRFCIASHRNERFSPATEAFVAHLHSRLSYAPDAYVRTEIEL